MSGRARDRLCRRPPARIPASGITASGKSTVGANIALIDMTARHAISSGCRVIVEGILRADYYGAMLTKLISDHADSAHAYFLHVPFDETLRRHATKPQANEYGEAEMRGWYRDLDLLPGGLEQVISADSTLEQTATRIMTSTRLQQTAGL
jgi:hypothetical protein